MLGFPQLGVVQAVGESESFGSLSSAHTGSQSFTNTVDLLFEVEEDQLNDILQIARTSGDWINEGFASFGRQLNFNNFISSPLVNSFYFRYSLWLNSSLSVSIHYLLYFRHDSKHFYIEKGPITIPTL